MLRKAALLVSLSTAHSARIASRAAAPIMALNDSKAPQLDGADSHPLFKWLRTELVAPADSEADVDSKGNGVNDRDVLVLPRGKFGGTTIVLWSPVSRTDIAWNFEKFLIGPDGKAVKRYSRYYDTNAIASDIDALL